MIMITRGRDRYRDRSRRRAKKIARDVAVAIARSRINIWIALESHMHGQLQY